MRAAAFIVGPADGPGAGLTDLARHLAMFDVMPYSGIAQAEAQSNQTPLCFFLFAAVEDVQTLRGVADAIRFSPSRRVRFSPLIYFSESPSIDAIAQCIAMGFDDVITMPFSTERVSERIRRQIGNTLTYYETAGYFGPDRRGRVTGPSQPAESRLGGQFRRLEIVRSLAKGTSVVRDDLYVHAADARSA